MNVLILCGSRNHQGQTGRAVDALAEGLRSAGAQCQLVFIPEKKIKRCRQCGADGWGTCRTEGRCRAEDDFAEVVAQIRAADAVAFATPVYFSDLSESLRTLLERLRRIAFSDSGKQGLAGKPAMGICVAGGGGGGAPACAVQLEKMLNNCGMDVVDMVPARRQNLEMKLGVLNHIGKWFATAPRSKSA
jgi:multimeric flavodoxin WrbA